MRRALLGTLTVALLVLSAGCGGRGKPDSVDKPSPTATSSTPTASPRDEAIKDAKAALAKYYRVTQKLHANPKGSHDVLQTVAVGRGLGTVALEIQDYVKNGWHAEGRSSYRVIGVGKVSLDNSAPAKGVVPSVILISCTDAAKTRVLDRTGKVVPGRQAPFQEPLRDGELHLRRGPTWGLAGIQHAARAGLMLRSVVAAADELAAA